MSNFTDIDIAFGGYYASIPEDGSAVSVFRLLDIDRFAYHAALYQERFANLPTVEQLAAIRPFIGHAPIDTRLLVGEAEVRLIG